MILRFSRFFLLAAAAALFALCSLSSTAYADLDEYDIIDEEVRVRYDTGYVRTDGGTNYIKYRGEYSANVTTLLEGDRISYSTRQTTGLFDDFHIMNYSEPIVSKHWGINFTFQGLYNDMTINSTSGNFWRYGFRANEITRFDVWVYDSVGNYVLLEDAVVDLNAWEYDGPYTMLLNIPSVPFDVHEIWVRTYYDFETGYGEDDSYYINGGNGNARYTFDRMIGFQNFTFSWSFIDPKIGLIEGLPGSIWQVFEDGIKGLFVPDEESIADMKNDWSDLIETRFGALAQTSYIVEEYVSAFQEREQSTISIPSITVPVAGTEWSFGGWEVTVVPQGMERLFSALKSITSIVATFLVINGLKRRFEGLIGGAPNA